MARTFTRKKLFLKVTQQHYQILLNLHPVIYMCWHQSKSIGELDEKIKEMINIDKPVIFDCVVDKAENCFPMIPSGKPHNQMILGPEEEEEISDEGKILV